ncbi:hypothetical protein PSACC_00887 [Paramicrosporidium saccamoebae]|uniref:Uncharacterized protein n=1 Tax=Paramicrosporidium saccamoebae TaxID=1246581 RepID=A0A2H9TNQ1_9FUNG|nr:hypothetical protein PSACC_00887 [Paramicrosporidium saccamoebae]
MWSLVFLAVTCVFSFASGAPSPESALVFGDGLGVPPPGHWQLTDITYEHRGDHFQVGLRLDSFGITVTGANFVAVTSSYQKEILAPPSRALVQAGDHVFVMVRSDETVTDEDISDCVIRSTDGPALWHCLNGFDGMSVFGFSIKTRPLLDERFQGHKHRSDWPIASESKRSRLADFVLQDKRLYCNYGNVNIDHDDTHVDIEANLHGAIASAHAELNGRGMTLTCKGGANILVLRDGQVEEGSIMPSREVFPDFDFNQEAVTLMSSYDEMTRSVEALYGDVVVILVPYKSNSNLTTLAGAQQLLGNPTDAVNNFDQFSVQFCGDNVIAYMFVVKPRKQDDY